MNNTKTYQVSTVKWVRNKRSERNCGELTVPNEMGKSAILSMLASSYNIPINSISLNLVGAQQ